MDRRDEGGRCSTNAPSRGYGCTFANASFSAPAGGVGLQVRYETGDPIVEQVSWVSGKRRFLVTVGHGAPPPGHERS